ncbi:MAG: hypothetical protein GX442_06225 [Candidatus Riflebacteria bacterium]|nr:hypothetical protein [Candidatus Riflebacteria bacterium]
MMLNEDYQEMLSALHDAGVEFILVGAYALAAHGFPRLTMDMDIWVRPTADNAAKVIQALQRFGAPLQGVTARDFEDEETVFQIGVAPRRVDLLAGLTGLRFDEAWLVAPTVEIAGLPLRVLSRSDLIRNKKALGRPKDLEDIRVLEQTGQP